MSKAEKEALWAQDRAMQALGAGASAVANASAAAAASAGLAGLLDPSSAATARCARASPSLSRARCPSPLTTRTPS
jgi:hypothetical protein